MSDAMRAVTKLYGDSGYYNSGSLRRLKNRQRRERQLRRRVITALVMLCVIVILSMFVIFSFKSDASSDGGHKQYRYYTSVSITRGDSVWSIADEYMDPMHYRDVASFARDIAHVNRISSDAKLMAGTSLIVPYYSDELK